MIFPLTYKRSILSLFRHRQFLSREIKLGYTRHKRVSVLKVCVKICLVEYPCLFFGFFCKYNETKKRVSPFETEYLIDKWTRLSVNVWALWIWWKENLSVWVFEGGSRDPKVLKKKKSNLIKRLLFAVEKRKNYNTLYGKLLQGLHIAESIFEGHLRDKSWSRVRFSVKNLHQSSHAVTIITNTNSTISTMSTFVNSQANLIFGHFQRAVSTSQQPQLSENLNRYQVVATLRYH